MFSVFFYCLLVKCCPHHWLQHNPKTWTIHHSTYELRWFSQKAFSFSRNRPLVILMTQVDSHICAGSCIIIHPFPEFAESSSRFFLLQLNLFFIILLSYLMRSSCLKVLWSSKTHLGPPPVSCHFLITLRAISTTYKRFYSLFKAFPRCGGIN